MAFIAKNVPTSPAVEKIRECHGELKPGDIIEYSTIEKCVYSLRNTNRFRTCVSAWKKSLFRENIIVEAVQNVGFKVLDSNKRIDFASKKEDKGIRSIRTAVYVANGTEKKDLCPDKKRYVEHLNRNYATILLSDNVKPKGLEFFEEDKK